MERKLAVILAADVAGFSRLVAQDEEGTLAFLATCRATIAELVREHGGRIFGSAGDSLIAEFASAVQGVRAAVAIQRAMHRRNADLAPDRRAEFRIGVNLGDVVVEDGDLLGDGVNVAARLQEIAEPGGICISAAVRDQIEGKLGFPLTAAGERRLRNIPRSAQVCHVDWRREDGAARQGPYSQPALPDKPSIAVLPFVNMSGDPEQEFFADGLTEDIITALSHYRWFFVIARNSCFTYKGRAIDVTQIARELGVRYVLEGSVRKAGGRVRVTGQLIEAGTGVHLWAQRYDRDYSDIFAIQDELTQAVVAAIEPEILMGEGRRASHRPTERLDAYECCMRGMWHHYQISADHIDEGICWQRRAIALDPDFSRAHMALTRALASRIVFGFSGDVAADAAELTAEAERALALDGRDPYCHYAVFTARLVALRLDEALAAAQKAIDLNPNFAFGHFGLGWVRVAMGRFAEALEPLRTGMRLSPHEPLTFHFMGRMALAHYGLGHYAEALDCARAASASRRVHPTLAILLACLGQTGATAEAAALLPEIEATTPADAGRYWQVVFPYGDPCHRAHLVEGLRKGGLPPDALRDAAGDAEVPAPG
ncbi:adenylate cyclase [Limibaculum sp. FT325]|uniref:adenylate/guanylate cyclase domain-containing protein n=1 Tax=Thermohalobaculum sediminis TaxID=2939436 RepID=UPI0020C122E1|nr:adenylate/guanylate cyclase domain-containing protein [Limibaculum sediminis]MCL5775681.1 adenylate cyclase [Limibaculum sediminis]